MASRRTRFTVYVDKDIMTKPTELFDAVLAHFIKKGMDIAERKVFLAGFMKIAGVDELDPKRIEFIDKWVLIRDVKTFPFRHNKKADPLGGPDGITEGDVDLSEEKADEDGVSCRRTAKGIEGTAKYKYGKEQGTDEDTGDSGGISVDDGADEESESGTTSE